MRFLFVRNVSLYNLARSEIAFIVVLFTDTIEIMNFANLVTILELCNSVKNLQNNAPINNL